MILNQFVKGLIMVRLPDEIKNYIYLNINTLSIPMVMRGFDVLDKFELPHYEDKYFGVMYNYEDIDAADMEANFVETLCRDIELIIRSHKINVCLDPSPRLEVIVRIAEGLYMLQDLEDYYMVERVMTTSNTNEMKFSQIIHMYTALDLIVILDAISSVESEFFKQLQELITSRMMDSDDTETTDPKRVITANFFKYLGDQDTIGGRLYRRGYDKKITFKELNDLLPFSLREFIRTEYDKGAPYAAINVLSILMLCSDTREQPITAYKEISEDLIGNPNDISIIYYILSNMHGEFINHYKEVLKEKVDEDDDQA